jgi:hypothetical protein
MQKGQLYGTPPGVAREEAKQDEALIDGLSINLLVIDSHIDTKETGTTGFCGRAMVRHRSYKA